MASTIVGLFDDREEARRAREDLINAGFNDKDINLVAEPAGTTGAEREPGFWETLKGIFGGEQEGEYYAEGTRRGGTVVAVDAPEESIDRAVDIMQAHHAVDIDRRAEEWRRSGWHGYMQGAQPSGGEDLVIEEQRTGRKARRRKGQESESIPVIREELAAGKRIIDRGGVRIIRRTTEQPVEEDIQLREERVRVERTKTDRAPTEAERQGAFEEKVIEARETAEEPVVKKEERVVEEVRLDKDVEQRTEKIRDTVRRDDVEIEELPGERDKGLREPREPLP
jgi:stress response protein YsnF